MSAAEMISDTKLQKGNIDDVFTLCNACCIHKIPQGLWGISSFSQPTNGGHPGIIPAADMSLVN